MLNVPLLMQTKINIDPRYVKIPVSKANVSTICFVLRQPVKCSRNRRRTTSFHVTSTKYKVKYTNI